MSQLLHELLEQQLQPRALGGTQTSSAVAQATSSATTSAPAATMSSNPNNGGTSSPLLFFVALGFGVVFTNLWIIVGVKYCFRYNARNRAIRNGEDPDPIGLENIPARPHRRRREKKLMTMDEVNERFPLTKYKSWVMNRASEGLPAAGGITAQPSRAASLRNVDATTVAIPPTDGVKTDAAKTETEKTPAPTNPLVQVQTTASTVDKHATRTSEDDDDDDEHIHTAVAPELLSNPGDACAICIDTLEDDDDIRGLTCGHAFHAGCLDPWLTSRRACCPLCKADYYTPKPRPEGEPVENNRSSRRGNGMPTAPASTWAGIRGNRANRTLPSILAEANASTSREDRRARRQAEAARAAAAAQPPVNGGAGADGVAQRGSTPNTGRWRPRNPFSGMQLPGRNRQQAAQANAEPSPSQLEAGRA